MSLRWLLGPVGNFGQTIPLVLPLHTFAIECGFSAILGFVIIAVATDDRVAPGVAPFAIGATVFMGALVAGPLTGGSFNPARSLGPAVASRAWTLHWMYWNAAVTGVVMGMLSYDDLRPTGVSIDVEPTGTDGPI